MGADIRAEVPCGWLDRGLMTVGMVYLILIRMTGWMALCGVE
jgi:hypothetical protein